MINKLKHIAGLGALMLLAAFAIVSCTDGNDWDTDSAYNRLFSVSISSISITPAATEAEVKWTKISGAEYYVIEVSKDTLYDEIAMGEGNSLVFGEDKSITQTPYTMTDLDSDSKYFIRVKCMSSKKAESKWSYLEKKSFKTKSEQIMNAVKNSDRTSTSVVLTWAPGERVTRIELVKGDAVVVTKPLGNTEIAEGKVELTDLDPGTAYQANLYNNDVRRGYALFSTYSAPPAADETVTLTESDVIDQIFMDDLAAAYPGKSITLILAKNATYTIAERLVIPDGMSITFYGDNGENKTVLIANVIDYEGSHNFIKFKNLDINCLDAGGYVMNQTNSAYVSEIEFNDCIIQNVVTTFFRIQGKDYAKVVESLVLDNCIFRNIGSGYSFIHVDAGSGVGSLKNLTMTNCTFDRICQTGKCFIFSKETNMESISITNCTFYKVIGASNYFADFSNTTYGPDNFVINNTILGMTGDATARGIRSRTLPSFDNTYATSDWAQASNKVDIPAYNGTAADLFEDPDNTDPNSRSFSFKDGSFDSNVGDPRWIK